MSPSKRKIIWTVLAVLIVGIGVVCCLRWRSWFGQPDELPYTPSVCPSRVLLTPGNSGELSRNVSWQCDSVLHDSFLEYFDLSDSTSVKRLNATGEVFASRAGKSAYYHVRLDSLAPDCRYAYRVTTNGRASQWYDFRTYTTGNRDFSFVYVGDVQDTLGLRAQKHLRQAFTLHPDAELLVCAGDLTERPRDADWAQTFVAVDSLCNSIPLLNVTGNHDYLKGLPAKLERRFPLVFSYFLDSMEDGNMVYRLRYANAEFFLLDTNRWIFDLFSQRSWLKKALAESDAKWKIVVLHHPLYSLRGKTRNLMQRWLLADIIEEGDVDLVLQGHEHNYGRMTPDGNERPIYLISHCSPKNYPHKNDKIFDKTHFNSRYYQYIRTHGDSLTVEAHEVETDSLIDAFSIVK